MLGRGTVEQFEGARVIRVDQEGREKDPAAGNAFRIFIDDKTYKKSMRLYFSHPQVNSGHWVFLGEIKSVQ